LNFLPPGSFPCFSEVNLSPPPPFFYFFPFFQLLSPFWCPTVGTFPHTVGRFWFPPMSLFSTPIPLSPPSYFPSVLFAFLFLTFMVWPFFFQVFGVFFSLFKYHVLFSSPIFGRAPFFFFFKGRAPPLVLIHPPPAPPPYFPPPPEPEQVFFLLFFSSSLHPAPACHFSVNLSPPFHVLFCSSRHPPFSTDFFFSLALMVPPSPFFPVL